MIEHSNCITCSQHCNTHITQSCITGLHLEGCIVCTCTCILDGLLSLHHSTDVFTRDLTLTWVEVPFLSTVESTIRVQGTGWRERKWNWVTDSSQTIQWLFYNDFLQECIGTGIWERACNSIKFETSRNLPPSTKNSNTYWAYCLDLSHCC